MAQAELCCRPARTHGRCRLASRGVWPTPSSRSGRYRRLRGDDRSETVGQREDAVRVLDEGRERLAAAVGPVRRYGRPGRRASDRTVPADGRGRRRRNRRRERDVDDEDTPCTGSSKLGQGCLTRGSQATFTSGGTASARHHRVTTVATTDTRTTRGAVARRARGGPAATAVAPKARGGSSTDGSAISRRRDTRTRLVDRRGARTTAHVEARSRRGILALGVRHEVDH